MKLQKTEKIFDVKSYQDLLKSRQLIYHRTPFIGRESTVGLTWRSPVSPAPYFRKEFVVEQSVDRAEIRFCGLGYGELYVNGQRVSSDVLSPTVTIYDRRTRFMQYDVAGYLKTGINVIAARLGNGWYNCHTAEVWHFDKASWRDSPKMWLELEINGNLEVSTDRSWRIGSGGIIFDGLRNGEFFDARLEPEGWMLPGFDDSSWEPAYPVAGPGGELYKQSAPPCRVLRRIAPVAIKAHETLQIVDFGENLTGWCAIEVCADAGTEFVIRHYESADADGIPEAWSKNGISQFVLSGEFQTDKYIAAGSGIESWRPSFTYHGFRYATIEIKGHGELKSINAEFVASDMRRIGDYDCDSNDFVMLKECAVRSYLGNFTGIPTDCPQREKNGWTGDAQLAAATGLFFFDSTEGYCEWLETLCDAQRPNGQLPSIVPTGGWGFNCASGPAWDCAIVRIPYEMYLHTGRKDIPERFYPAMVRYIGYLKSREEADGTLDFGLADWCAPQSLGGHVPCRFSSTAYYIHMLDLIARMAKLIGNQTDVPLLLKDRDRLLRSFRSAFSHGKGSWGGDTPTELALVLEFGLFEGEEEYRDTAQRLAEIVENLNFHAEFGIIGAKYVPRALASCGYIDHAWKILTQPEYPGWVNWLRQGATTLFETWEANSSLNHMMFGDFPAWAFEYLAGLRLDEDFASGKRLLLRPNFPSDLNKFSADWESSYGKISISWQRGENGNEFKVVTDSAIKIEVQQPDIEPTLS